MCQSPSLEDDIMSPHHPSFALFCLCCLLRPTSCPSHMMNSSQNPAHQCSTTHDPAPEAPQLPNGRVIATASSPPENDVEQPPPRYREGVEAGKHDAEESRRKSTKLCWAWLASCVLVAAMVVLIIVGVVENITGMKLGQRLGKL